ncbi:glycoside hydrolase family 3 C-terminal domain-containing protein [Flavicella sp.]|uniref:glycoside hydrolase family 3 C-terminal domain-containing protein n=1 Tax=Flavicella sp. TaxID=2957742 RepID=UPI002606A270|nr:glycoside hydrolase family 3 C-terminal domain-containing protein [Flavicella sp.]MDG1805143.1 glycoside hydrolase family 3 C-terminal domain-containing protein [Flavicella sp.]
MNYLKKISSVVFFMMAAFSMNAQVWKDANANIDDRVEDLLSKMTLEEKISYCGSRIPAIDRLGVPYFEWYGEALHGIIGWNCTQFPQNIAMGSTWNPDLMFDVATAISNESRALKNIGKKEVMMFSPTVNMARDPRWGRNEECYSEDPHLMSEMARMYIRGMQGNDPKYVKTVTTVKHYVANNVDKGREKSHSNIGKKDLYEYYFPAYKTCVVDENATGIMTALNGLNGVPCSANKWLVNDVLRKQWGFEGYVIADWTAVQGLETRMHYASSQAEAAAMAIKAGVDQECYRNATKKAPMVYALPTSIEEGLITEEEVNVSVRRMLKLRFRTGDFDDPSLNPYSKIPRSVLECDAHKKLALKAAEQSIVLLKNKKDMLPLKKDIKSIGVVGPFADRCWLGIYSGNPKSKISPLQGIKNSTSAKVLYAEGCSLAKDKEDAKKIAEAVEVAKKSEYVVVLVGNDEATATENVDRKTLKLPGNQHKLIKELQKVNKNVIVVLIPSGATDVSWEQDNVPAILCAWANGQEQGTALAKVLFGDVNPGGKLNATWFKSDNDLPDFNDYNVKNGRTYMYFKGDALYPFGYGLSYTDFEIEKVVLDVKTLKPEQYVTVTATVKNTGNVDGDEVVQVYIKDGKSSKKKPIKALKGFERVSVASGASKTVEIKIPYEAFAYYNVAAEKFKVKAGKFQILVGNSSDAISEVKTLKVEAGSIPEIKVGEKSAYYNFDPAKHGRSWDYLYTNASDMSTSSTKKEDTSSWVEYEITFLDPGFYVNTWDAELTFKSASKEAIIETFMAGNSMDNYTILNNQRKLKIKIPIPPEYGQPVRLRIKTRKGEVAHESIKIIPPGKVKPFVISKIIDRSKN